jgi:hypothetical protein
MGEGKAAASRCRYAIHLFLRLLPTTTDTAAGIAASSSGLF